MIRRREMLSCSLVMFALGCAALPTIAVHRDELEGAPCGVSTNGSMPLTCRATDIYIPNPDQTELAAARTAKTPNPLDVRVGYCIGTNGKTSEVRVLGGDLDPAMSQVALDVVAKWRFKPAMIDGRAIETCTEVEFTIEFE